ncbi:hypothetical protein KBA73_04145, partial [Patescibacteria group bacterium]|nr:hypothetical protein [Patescibacteria group bacterium]
MARIPGKEELRVHERLDEQTERELEEYAARAPERDDHLMREAFRNLLTSRTLTPFHDESAMAEFRIQSREKMKELRARGVHEVPAERRLRMITSFLDDFTRVAAQKSDPDVFRRYTRALRDIVGEFDLDQSFFRGPIRGQILYLLIQQRYRFAFDYAQRRPLIDEIETLTDISEAEELPTSQIKDYVFDALTKLFSQRPFGDLESYLKEVFPLVTFNEQELGHLHVSLSQVISLLANEDNPSFPEQVRSLQWRKLIGELKPREKSEWVKNSVKAHGLFIDPQDAAASINTQSDCAYERELRDYCLKVKAATIKRRTEGGAISKEVDPEQLPNRVLFAYLDGWSAVVDVLEKGSEHPSDKLAILRRLIHGVASEAFFMKIGSEVHPLEELFASFERLPFSPEVKKDLVQEVYASYTLRTSKVFDTASVDVPLPALEINHPAIQTARFRITKTYLSDPKNQVNSDNFSRGFYHNPALLSPVEWSENQFIMLGPLLEATRRSEVMRARQNFKESRIESFNEPLSRRFKEYMASSKEEFESLSQMVIVHTDRIRQFCASSPEFNTTYEEWLATQVGMGRYRLSHAEHLPGREGAAWSRSGYAKIIEVALISNSWDVIDELYASVSEEQAWLKERIELAIKDQIYSHLRFSSDLGSRQWILHVVHHYPELIRTVQKETRFQWQSYHEFIGSLYYEDNVDDVLQEAPGVDLKDTRIQHVLAKRALRPVLSKTGEAQLVKDHAISAEDLARIDWANAGLRELLGRSTINAVIKDFTRMGSATDAGDPFRGRIEGVQRVTGYHVTDPVFVDFNELSSIDMIIDALTQRRKLVDCFGEQPGEHDRIYALAQERVDHLCSHGRGKAQQYLALQRAYAIAPSKNALQHHLRYSIIIASGLEDSMSLLNAFKVPTELSPEELESLPRSSPRIEALIYTLLLPRKGPERVAAEKVYRARSSLAAIIPQLLAIQSPTKRVEFCPYQNGLTPLLQKTAYSLKSELQVQGLLLFLKEFGMQDLPNLAMAVVELYESVHSTNPLAPSSCLAQLEEVLGMGKEQWTMELYLAKIRALQHAIRQAILEDAPLDARIESSAIGMEIFNALIRDSGQYRDVTDRAGLLALTRTNKKELLVDPLFKPASKFVEVAEQESFSVSE